MVVGILRLWRGAMAARIGAIVLALEALFAIGAWRIAGPAQPAVAVCQAFVLLYVLGAARGRMPHTAWRVGVTWPALWFLSGAFLAVPWMVLGVTRGAWIPWAIAAAGFVWSLGARRETVTLDLTVPTPPALARLPAMARRRRGMSGPGHPGLRIVQISDPHLGPFMSAERLSAICQRAVDAQPDLILLTGDFFTFEAQGTPGVLGAALAPLRAHPRVFACRGNHDHEAPATVLAGLDQAGVRFLLDEACVVDTRVGPIQLVGMDFRWRDRARHMRAVLDPLPRGPFRLVMLHDPGAFSRLPPGSADLVLSGHTHGGHVGLVAFGLDWTFVGAVTRIPDHGPWGWADNRLYVHRAQGHYGYPLRLGVPAEESVLEIVHPKLAGPNLE